MISVDRRPTDLILEIGELSLARICSTNSPTTDNRPFTKIPTSAKICAWTIGFGFPTLGNDQVYVIGDCGNAETIENAVFGEKYFFQNMINFKIRFYPLFIQCAERKPKFDED